MRTDERSAVFGFGQFKGEATAMLVHAPNTPSRFVKQAMTMRLSGRDEDRVMKAITGVSAMAMGKELTRPNGDCGVDKVNSVTERRDEAVEPISQSADMRLLARRNSSDGSLDLDE
jgi:hypothetical protein